MKVLKLSLKLISVACLFILVLAGCESEGNLIVQRNQIEAEIQQEQSGTASLYSPTEESGTKVQSTPTMGKEDIIKEYITYLSEVRDPTKRGNFVNIQGFGMWTEPSDLPTMTLEEAEKAGLLNLESDPNVHADNYASVAVQQHDLVIAQFGSDAWENVTYTLEEIDPVDGSAGYRIVSTRELISRSEYDSLLRKYWENVAEQEGVTFYDIFLADDEPPEMMKNKRTDIIVKYSDDMPVELTLISDAQFYSVHLSFNGERVSNEKFENFHFIIDNRNDHWVVFQGLTWAAPLPEFPEGD